MDESYNLWAIVKVAGGQYIGKLDLAKRYIIREVKDTGCIFMKPAYEYNMLMNQTPQGLQRMPLAVPVSVCLEDVGVWLWPSSILFFDEMSEKDLASHKSVVEAALKDIQRSRAANAGLSLPDDGRFGGGDRFG